MPTAAELLAALPAEDADVQPDRSEALERIFRSLGGKPIPAGAFRRLYSLSGLSAKLGLGYLAYWIRSWYRPTEAREKDLLEMNLRGALHTLETMGYLRGAVAKVGQLMSCLPDLVTADFAEVMSELHFNAPPMHYALIREQLLSELGEPAEVFAEFNEVAIAAASIGQVHEAQLPTGECVAVKVQYPGVARSIQSDLRNLKTMMRPFLFNDDWRAMNELFDELRTGLEFETDYEHELQNLRDVRRLFVDDDDIVVPDAFEHLSTRRVLTMEFIAGKRFDEYLASDPPQSERDRYGTLISKAIYRTYTANLLYTDPHPGNFLFMDDGRLGFIDFGNIRRFTDDELEFKQAIDQIRFETDAAAVRALCQRSAMMTDAEAQSRPEVLDLIVEMLDYYNEPIIYEGKFDYGDPAYLRRGAELMARASKSRWVKQKKQNVFAHRLNLVLPSLLFLLKSRVNVPQLLREEVDPQP